MYKFNKLAKFTRLTIIIYLISIATAQGEQLDKHQSKNEKDYDNIKQIYKPSVELSSRSSKNRNIFEIDYMQPLSWWSLEQNKLAVLDLKIKFDDHKNKELNLGALYRYNHQDRFIIGAYSFFDHKITNTNFHISGLTVGGEFLSKYVDGRINYYLPENKKKKIIYNNSKTIKITDNALVATAGGDTYERGLKGYDVELGTPLFGFSNYLNEKLGTKILVAHYEFYNKHTKSVKGNRIRIEQKLASLQFARGNIDFTFNGLLKKDAKQKAEIFLGIGAKYSFGKVIKTKGLKSRMMDAVVRDIDIVTLPAQDPDRMSSLFLNNRSNQKIEQLIYAGATEPVEGDEYIGNGTKDKPLSLNQLKNTDTKKAIIILVNIEPRNGGRPITKEEYDNLVALPNVVNGKSLNLISSDNHDVHIHDSGSGGIHIVNNDFNNTKIVINQAASISVEDKKNKSMPLLITENKLLINYNKEQVLPRSVEQKTTSALVAEIPPLAISTNQLLSVAEPAAEIPANSSTSVQTAEPLILAPTEPILVTEQESIEILRTLPEAELSLLITPTNQLSLVTETNQNIALPALLEQYIAVTELASLPTAIMEASSLPALAATQLEGPQISIEELSVNTEQAVLIMELPIILVEQVLPEQPLRETSARAAVQIVEMPASIAAMEQELLPATETSAIEVVRAVVPLEQHIAVADLASLSNTTTEILSLPALATTQLEGPHISIEELSVNTEQAALIMELPIVLAEQVVVLPEQPNILTEELPTTIEPAPVETSARAAVQIVEMPAPIVAMEQELLPATETSAIEIARAIVPLQLPQNIASEKLMTPAQTALPAIEANLAASTNIESTVSRKEVELPIIRLPIAQVEQVLPEQSRISTEELLATIEPAPTETSARTAVQIVEIPSLTAVTNQSLLSVETNQNIILPEIQPEQLQQNITVESVALPITVTETLFSSVSAEVDSTALVATELVLPTTVVIEQVVSQQPPPQILTEELTATIESAPTVIEQALLPAMKTSKAESVTSMQTEVPTIIKAEQKAATAPVEQAIISLVLPEQHVAGAESMQSAKQDAAIKQLNVKSEITLEIANPSMQSIKTSLKASEEVTNAEVVLPFIGNEEHANINALDANVASLALSSSATKDSNDVGSQLSNIILSNIARSNKENIVSSITASINSANSNNIIHSTEKEPSIIEVDLATKAEDEHKTTSEITKNSQKLNIDSKVIDAANSAVTSLVPTKSDSSQVEIVVQAKNPDNKTKEEVIKGQQKLNTDLNVNENLKIKQNKDENFGAATNISTNNSLNIHNAPPISQAIIQSSLADQDQEAKKVIDRKNQQIIDKTKQNIDDNNSYINANKVVKKTLLP